MNKPDLFVANNSIAKDYPQNIISEFKALVDSGSSASSALRNVMSIHDLKDIHSTVIRNMLREAYPDIDLQGVGGWLFEKHYPERTDLASDEDFDMKIKELVEESLLG